MIPTVKHRLPPQKVPKLRLIRKDTICALWDQKWHPNTAHPERINGKKQNNNDKWLNTITLSKWWPDLLIVIWQCLIASKMLFRPIQLWCSPKYFWPHCCRALEALRSFSERTGFAEPFVIDLATVDGMMKTKEQIATVTGRRKVPNVFVGSTLTA